MSLDFDMLMLIGTTTLGGGGAVAIIKAILDRKKNRSEVTDINVRTAVELEKMAMSRYVEASQSLDDTQKQLSQIKSELSDAKIELSQATVELSKATNDYESYRRYCMMLQDALKQHNVSIPDMPE